MRGTPTFAVLLGIVLLAASLPVAAVVTIDGSYLRTLTTAELFEPGARWQQQDLSLAIPMWLTIAACLGAAFVTARNNGLTEAPRGFTVTATWLVAAVTVAAPFVALIGAAQLAAEVNGFMGAGPALFLAGAACFAYLVVVSLRAHENNEPQIVFGGE